MLIAINNGMRAIKCAEEILQYHSVLISSELGCWLTQVGLYNGCTVDVLA